MSAATCAAEKGEMLVRSPSSSSRTPVAAGGEAADAEAVDVEAMDTAGKIGREGRRVDAAPAPGAGSDARAGVAEGAATAASEGEVGKRAPLVADAKGGGALRRPESRPADEPVPGPGKCGALPGAADARGGGGAGIGRGRGAAAGRGGGGTARKAASSRATAGTSFGSFQPSIRSFQT